MITRSSLAADLTRLGVRPGGVLLVHAAFSTVGRVLGGPDALVDALLDALGPDGTLVSYQDWELGVDVWDADGRIPAAVRPHVPPFDPATARPARDHGILALVVATRRGVLRSANPGAGVCALGARAYALTTDHALDDGYGAGSPFARIVALGGQVLMLGAPPETMTLLHHAEAVADLPGARRVRYEYPFADPDAPDGVRWETVSERDTSRPVVPGLADDYFAEVVGGFVAEDAVRRGGHVARGRVGEAAALLVDAAAITAYAVAWLEER